MYIAPLAWLITCPFTIMVGFSYYGISRPFLFKNLSDIKIEMWTFIYVTAQLKWTRLLLK